MEIMETGKTLEQLETIIEENLLAFVSVGTALIDIRNNKKYLRAINDDTGEEYRTFTEYMKSRWHPSKRHLYYCMTATEIHAHLEKCTAVHFLPSSEYAMRPLAKLASPKQVELGNKNPDVWIDAWQTAVKDAGNKEPTEENVASAVEEIIKAKHRPTGIIAPVWTGNLELDNVYLADSTQLDFLKTLPENSIDMVFTDPPWDAESLVCYEAAARLSARVLKPGSYLAIYCGKMFLPEILSVLGKWLDYSWTMCVYQPDNNHSTSHGGIGIFEAWRPIAIYRKPGENRDIRFEPDALKCTRQKEWHDWQQGIEPVKKYIEQLTNPGEIVLDPFVGGGTSIMAAKKTGRHYLGFDKNEDAVKNTIARLQ